MTSPCRTGVAATSTIRAPRRASSTPSTAARREAWRRPRRSSSTSTPSPRDIPSSRSASTRSSDDGNLLAYSLDYTGFREYTLFVKDLGTGGAAARPRREGVQRGVGGGPGRGLLRHRGSRQAALPAPPPSPGRGTPSRTRCSTRRRTSCSASGCGARAAAPSYLPARAASRRRRRAISPRRTRREAGTCSPPARRITSTTWTTGATSSTSAPTGVVAGTSAW